MSQELITQKIDELNALPVEDTAKLNIPVSIALQEAEDLYDWCQKDKEDLVRAGIDWKLVEDLPIRTGALRVSQAKWSTQYKNFKECQAEWKVAAPEAYKLRDELVHHFYHALYGNPKEYAKVQRIDEGSTHADMIQDLIDLAELGMNHPNELEAIGVDLSILSVAREKSFELAELLARVNGSNRETSPQLDVRNKAYNHLKDAVDEIRRVGQYVFWKNDKKLKGYASIYLRRKNRSYSRKEEGQTSEIAS